MDVTWLGHCCFLLRGSALSILTDPFDGSTGYRPGKVQADVVTISYPGPRHGQLDMVSGYRKAFSGPGEYEIGDAFIFGIKSYRDAGQGPERPRNTIYRILLDGLVICHLGAIGHVPTSDQVTAIGDVDVLLVPVGGGGALTPAQATEVVSLLEPKIVVPMMYKTLHTTLPLEPVDVFLKEQGVAGAEPVARLTVTKSSIASGPQVVLLEPRLGR